MEDRPRLRRPMPRATERLLILYAGLLILSGGLGAGIIGLSSPSLVLHPGLLAGVCAIAVGIASLLIFWGITDPEFAHRAFTGFAYLLLVGAPMLVSAGQYSTGPRTLIATVLYVEVPIFAVYLIPPLLAAAMIALVSLEFGLVLALQHGYASAVAEWAFLSGTLVAIGAIFGGLLSRALDEANTLMRLKRFLAPQIAEAILSSDSESLLDPHSREIAVLFCDLRGFTRFASQAEPDEIVELLQSYYRAVGDVLRAAEATVGFFAGDGIMAYFNDPVPCPDPADRAVRVATLLHDPLEDLRQTWTAKGFDLGYGIGIAFGYATLGRVGLEDRSDYTALGPVVNLASRLCAEASSGEILLDQRAYDEVSDDFECDARRVTLKGYATPVPAYRIVCAAPSEVAQPR